MIRLQYLISVNMTLRRQYEKNKKVTASSEYNHYIKKKQTKKKTNRKEITSLLLV